MPYIENPQLISASAPQHPASPALGERIDFVLGFLRRRYLVIGLSLLLSLALAALYLFTAPPDLYGFRGHDNRDAEGCISIARHLWGHAA